MGRLLRLVRNAHPFQMAISFGVVAFAVALASYATIGSFMRYSGDDYCYGSVLTQHGFWKSQWYSYFNLTPYHGNRYSLTLLSGIAGLFPPIANGILPGLALILWVSGLTWLIHSVSRLFNTELTKLVSLLLAELIVFLTLYQAPDLSQSLYWRSGMLPYLAPLITGMFLVGLILWQIERERSSNMVTVGVGVVAFFSAGFSEVGAVLSASFLVFALLITMKGKRSGASWAGHAVLPIGIALLGTVLALLAIILSPPNQLRQMKLPPPPDLMTLADLSFRHATDFITGSFKALSTPSIYNFAFCIVLSYALAIQEKVTGPLSLKRVLFITLSTSLVVYLLVVSCMVPFAYTQLAYPEPRALIIPRFVMVLGAIVIGWTIGRGGKWLYDRSHLVMSTSMLASAFLLGFMAFYPLRAARNVLAELPRYQKWASFWDTRDHEIRDAKLQGNLNIEVVEIDHIIPRVADLSSDPGTWYNQCASGYYGVVTISATRPGWDE